MVDKIKMREVCNLLVSFYENDALNPLFGLICAELAPEFIYYLAKEYVEGEVKSC